MSFKDVLKKSFLDNSQVMDVNVTSIIVVLLVACLLGIYVFAVYRLVAKNNFYQVEFAISLPMLTIVTAAIILTIQSSVVISLGMVGALSIVRFRTAIKNPMDLLFLFWSISIGIISGAGIFSIAVIVSLILTILLFILIKLPVGQKPQLLVLNCDNNNCEDDVIDILEDNTKMYKVKTRNMTANHMDMIIEVRAKNDGELLRKLQKIEHMQSVSLLSHDGEVTY